MQKNTAKQTQALLKTATTNGTKLRHLLISLQRGESLTVKSADWPFKSAPAEYLYTMRRLGRTYSYRYIDPTMGATSDEDILIVRTK